MMISRKMLKTGLFGLVFVLMSQAVFAEAEVKNDDQVVAEVTKFSEESGQMREAHIQQMREIHLKHINELYDMKLNHTRENAVLWKQLKAGDKKGNKALREQIKKKREDFKKAEKEFKKNFQDNVLNKQNKEFRNSMKIHDKKLKDAVKE